jgi:hypothetical protein
MSSHRHKWQFVRTRVRKYQFSPEDHHCLFPYDVLYVLWACVCGEFKQTSGDYAEGTWDE